MAGFKLSTFRGIRPRIAARLLGEGEAQTASNLRLGSGRIEPWDAKTTDTATCNAGNIETIYRYHNLGSPVWFEWTTDVDAVSGPLKNDALDRVYFTGDGQPKMTYSTIATGGGCLPADDRNLGIPAPTSAPSASTTAINTSGKITPSNIAASEIYIGSVIWDHDGSDPVTSASTYPGTCTASNYWELESDISVEFRIFDGTLLEVESIPDADNFTVKDASGKDYIGWFGYDRDINRHDYGSCVYQQAVAKGLRLPNGLKLTETSHNLRVGDVIKVSGDATLTFSPTAGQNLYDGTGWDGDPYAYNDGTFDPATDNEPYYHRRDGVTLWHNAAGTTDFDIEGEFAYSIQRGESAVAETDDRTYVYTYVSALGEEGPPSDPSSVIEALDGDTISLTGLVAPPTSGYDITEIRVYRSNATADAAEYQFVAEVTLPATTYSDAVANADLGEVLSTTSWDPPPTGMKGLVALPNGMMAGFSGKTVHFCEPYFPHAWPAEYDQAVGHDIVALGAFGNSLVVMTEGQPSVATGSHPRNMNLRRVEFNQACSSKKSVAQYGDSVLYASPDGIVAAGINGFSLISKEYFTKKEWQAYDPTSMVAEVYDDRYIIFYDNGSDQGYIVFNPTDPLIGLSTGDESATGVYLDIENDDLYITDGTSIFQWDSHASTDLTYTWKSKKLKAEYPMNPGAGIVDADAYPVTFKLYADETLRATITVNNDEPFRLPGGYLESLFEVEVTGTAVINKIHIAESVYELAEE